MLLLLKELTHFHCKPNLLQLSTPQDSAMQATWFKDHRWVLQVETDVTVSLDHLGPKERKELTDNQEETVLMVCQVLLVPPVSVG